MNRITTVLVIASLAALACNAPINFALSTEPTPTATVALTDTPLPTPTLEATPTPRPIRPDIEPTATYTPTAALLSLEAVTLQDSDLPRGFSRFNDEAEDDFEDLVDGEYFYEVDHVFGYGLTLENAGEIIFGYPVIFPSDDPFNAGVDPDDQVDQGLRDFADFLGGSELTDEGELTRLGGIGEEAVGYYIDALTSNDDPFRVEVIAFRRGTAGVYVYHVYPQDYSPSTSLADVAFLLDARLLEALAQ